MKVTKTSRGIRAPENVVFRKRVLKIGISLSLCQSHTHTYIALELAKKGAGLLNLIEFNLTKAEKCLTDDHFSSRERKKGALAYIWSVHLSCDPRSRFSCYRTLGSLD